MSKKITRRIYLIVSSEEQWILDVPKELNEKEEEKNLSR